MSELLGQTVLPSLEEFVTNLIVDLAGLSVPPKLSMIVTALLLVTTRPSCPLKTLCPAALALLVLSPWAAMVANHLVPGSGSPLPVSPLAVTGLTTERAPPASHTACNPVLTTLTLLQEWSLVTL